jgi:type VI secretion system protein ImpH
MSGWRGDRSLEDSLFHEPYAFEFFQAVRLLHLRSRRRARALPGDEPVRFRASFDLGFPPSDIRELRTPAGGDTPEMTVAFFGVGGCGGPLPTSFTEEILGRLSRHDTATTAFLDIFHHRLVSLLYRIRQAHRLELTTEAPVRTPAARYLFSLFGLGMPSLASQLHAPAALLRYAGLLAHRPRSAAGLATLLSDAFGVPVQVQQFAGAWTDIDTTELTHIGAHGCNNMLGRSATLGTRVWIQDAGIRLRVGPLEGAAFEALLPGGPAHDALLELTHFYAGAHLHVDVQLVMRGPDVSQATVGASRLAWGGWLRRTPLPESDDQVRVRMRRALPPRRSRSDQESA